MHDTTNWHEAATPDAVDLCRHAVIEASAGTGKTYTLEHLVLAAVAEGVPIDSILVVTFTEKATGELKQRIRKLLHKRERDTDSTSMREAALAFDRAQIMTIHGFCHQILRQYAFENRLLLEAEIAPDREIAAELFANRLRTQWAEHYLPSLDEEAQQAALAETFYRDVVLDLVARLKPGQRLLPEPVSERERVETIEGIFARLSAVFGPVCETVQHTPFCMRYAQLDFAASKHGSGLQLETVLDELLVPLLECVRHFQTVEADAELLGSLETWYGNIRYKKFLTDKRFAVLVPPRYQAPSECRECPELEELLPVLHELDACMQPAIAAGQNPALMIAASEICALQEQLRAFKQSRGLVSYDDMLLCLAEALDPAKNPQAKTLIRSLQGRYKLAFVDEFQDTDDLQWEIFRRVFADSDSRLCVIGDPKQAIYSFRGADVHTYDRAVGELACSYDAERYVLPTNWRSNPELIDAFNRLFASTDWFGDAYHPVRAAPREEARYEIVEDRTGRSAVTVVDLRAEGRRVQEARRLLADFVADEIVSLLSDRPLIHREGESAGARLKAQDIAILVRNARESEALEAALRGRQVPFAYYKKKGLYQTEEAFHVHVLLAAVHQPYHHGVLRRALLTPFFAAPVESLAATEALTSQDAIRILFTRWEELAQARDWSALFAAILAESGLLLRLSGEQNGERAATNYQHIFQELLAYAHARAVELPDLMHHLHNCMHGYAQLSEEADIQRLESERSNVQIMTMHVSKGLEFPVVFVAGGFSGPFWPRYWRVHEEDGVVYDLAKAPGRKVAFEREAVEDDRRLMYVACTRAIHKLYVPLFTDTSKRPVRSALATFVHRAILASWLQDAPTVQRVAVEERPVQVLTENEPEREVGTMQLPVDWLLPRVDFCERTRHVLSFSSMQSHAAVEEHLVADEPGQPFAQVAQDEPLPPGAPTGSMLHGLFELGDWDELSGLPIEELLAGESGALALRLCDEFGVSHQTTAPPEESARKGLELVQHVLRVSLPNGVVLSQIKAKDRIAELSFLFSRDEQSAIKGFVDLVYRHAGLIYIVDWKSNWLDSYEPDGVAAAMDAAGYHLQYRLYTLALARWLTGGDLAAFYPQFGGVFYVFLRGFDGNGNGVYFQRPDTVDELERWSQSAYGR